MNPITARSLAQCATLVFIAGCQAASPALSPPSLVGGPPEVRPGMPALVAVGSGAMVAAGAGNLKLTNALARREGDDARCGEAPAGAPPVSREAERGRAGSCPAVTNGTIVDTPRAETF